MSTGPVSSEALEARLDDLRQVCFAPGDAYSAGEWCEAANEGVQIALALLGVLAVAREREQRLRDVLTEIGAVCTPKRHMQYIDRVIVIRRIVRVALAESDVERNKGRPASNPTSPSGSASAAADEPGETP